MDEQLLKDMLKLMKTMYRLISDFDLTDINDIGEDFETMENKLRIAGYDI